MLITLSFRDHRERWIRIAKRPKITELRHQLGKGAQCPQRLTLTRDRHIVLTLDTASIIYKWFHLLRRAWGLNIITVFTVMCFLFIKSYSSIHSLY